MLQRQFSFSSKWGGKSFFGLSNTNSQRCFYKINKTGSHLRLPYLAIELDTGEIVAGSSYGYINLYSMKDGIIYEHLVHKKKIRKDLGKSIRESENFNRITFAKNRDDLGRSSFKFLGVFKKTGKVKVLKINGKEEEFAVHEMFSNRINPDGKF